MKDTVKKIRRQATDWEKIFAKDKSDKGLLSKIHKDFLKTIIIIFTNGPKTLTNASPKKIHR